MAKEGVGIICHSPGQWGPVWLSVSTLRSLGFGHSKAIAGGGETEDVGFGFEKVELDPKCFGTPILGVAVAVITLGVRQVFF